MFIVACKSENSSDGKPKVEVYSKDHLTFELPKYWKVSEDSEQGAGRYIEIENKEPFGSGLIVISILDTLRDNVEMAESMQATYKRIMSEERKNYEVLQIPKEIKIDSINGIEGKGQVRFLNARELVRFIVYDLPNNRTVFFSTTMDWKDEKKIQKISEQILTSLKFD